MGVSWFRLWVRLWHPLLVYTDGMSFSTQRPQYVWQNNIKLGKRRLSGDTERQATSGEVSGLKREMRDLKEVVADLTLENRILKKSVIGDGEDTE